MTPREPDRFDKQAWEIWDTLRFKSGDIVGLLAAALRAAESSALEQAAQLMPVAQGYGPELARKIRALIPPAAAPAAEGECWSDVHWCAQHGQPLSECTAQGRAAVPAADPMRIPLPGLRRGEPAAETGKARPDEAYRIDNLRASLAAAGRRIAELETAIRWALGEEGEFPTREPYEGAYWWRTELRRRAARAAPQTGVKP